MQINVTVVAYIRYVAMHGN